MNADPPPADPRRPAISLRVLLLIVLACGLWLGWVAHRAWSQRMAIEAIREYGGFVQYDWEYVNGTLTAGREPWAPRS